MKNLNKKTQEYLNDVDEVLNLISELDFSDLKNQNFKKFKSKSEKIKKDLEIKYHQNNLDTKK
tara:strand:- start:78 stop:266 length:189 start_codon:yes stop_codon:yes gene_type:complete